MNKARLAPVASFLIFSTACGGEPPPPPEAPPAPKAVAAPRAAVDLSPVPEPRALVLAARIARPNATIRTAADWMQIPAPPGGVVSQAITDMDAGDVIDLSQPIDFALTIEGSSRSPKIAWAVSAPLLPGNAGTDKLRDKFVMTPGDGGIVRLDPKKGEEEDSDRRCAIYPAHGPATARLVCGETESAVRDLGPWLARTRTRAPLGKDIEIEARGAPMRGILTEGRQLFPALIGALVGARSIAGLSTLVNEMAGDIIDLGTDLDRIVLDANLGDTGLEANMRLAFAGSSSLTGRLISANADKAGPPPDAFNKLPVDADQAFYGRGWDDRELARPKEVLFQFARGLLEKEGIAKADSEVLERAVNGYMSLGSSGWVSAGGLDWTAAAPALKKLEDAHKSKKVDAIVTAEGAALEKLSGWSLWGVELPMAKVQATVKDVVAAYNRPTLQKAVKPIMSEGVPLPTLKTTAVSAAAKLPKESMHVELAITRKVDESLSPRPAGKGKVPVKLAKPLRVHVFVVPDGARTWLAWGMDEATVTERARAVVAGGGQTLAARAGIEALRDGKLSGGGFFDARTFARPDEASSAIFKSAGELELGTQMPSGDWGKTPMLFSVRGEGSGDKRATTLSIRIPREAIKDLGSEFVKLGRRKSTTLMGPVGRTR